MDLHVPFWLLDLLVAAGMVPQDVVGTGLMMSEARTLSWWPGVFDAHGDAVGTYGNIFAAVGGMEFGPFSWQTAALVATKMVVSYHTTNRMVPRIGHLFDRMPDMGAHPWRKLAAAILRRVR